MKFFVAFICILLSFKTLAQTQVRTIHVFVALCDNKNQGIVPVPEKLGNGKDTRNNLYWGAGYGVKNFFKNKTKDWQLIKTIPSGRADILERLLYKHTTKNVYMLADAYDGAKIKTCIEDFLKATNGQNSVEVIYESRKLVFAGQSDLVSYVGHDGLMDFDIDIKFDPEPKGKRDVIILACYSKNYFSPEIKKAQANPVLWTTHLMAPEAYTLKSAIDGWILRESGTQIDERAAQTYHKYQKCGIKGARNLFTTGF
ncbi:hypothetical protein [Aquimarina sp. 2201CG5-10]|uniref:hypothetical protein n=1 Tax=Aquimarina callyspongiae TaxID=3098150 RepID=UPI002AB52C2B|nr:hypothetical protein [Aquimarina sp. 2201CG5-10]MDY8137793.1 hypothetical protein [Aquimarina sp. 2201CG5-10]